MKSQRTADLFDLTDRLERIEMELGLGPVELRESEVTEIFELLEKGVELSEIQAQYTEVYGDRADSIDWAMFQGKQLPGHIREALLGGFMPLSDLEEADRETLSDLKIDAELSEYNLEFLELVEG